MSPTLPLDRVQEHDDGMKPQEKTLWSRIPELATAFAMVVIWLALARIDLALFIAGLLIGAVTIMGIVRRINRRDDPRHSTRPTDAP